jgi:hypothetical protein
MPAKKQSQTPLRYSRKKGHVEIDGDPADVKKLAQDERYERIIKWCVLLLVALILKVEMPSAIWKFIAEVIRRFLISAFIVSLLKLSG